MVIDVETAAGVAMTRRVAVTGGVLAGVSGFAMPGGSAHTAGDAAPVARTLMDRLQGTPGPFRERDSGQQSAEILRLVQLRSVLF